MLIQTEKAEERLSSPGNLINRLRAGVNGNSRSKAMSLFTSGKKVVDVIDHKPKLDLPVFKQGNPPAELPIEVLPPEDNNAITADHILADVDSKIKLETVAKEALSCLHEAVVQLKINIPSMRADKLPDVAAKMSKVVADIRDKQRDKDEKPVHLHFYAPERRRIEEYPEVVA